MFSTIGKVERAEIQYEPNGRSRGTGVVELESVEVAETAISMFQWRFYAIPGIYQNVLTSSLDKFSGYQYGGRPLGITFVKYLTPGAHEPMNGNGPADAPPSITQDQIM